MLSIRYHERGANPEVDERLSRVRKAVVMRSRIHRRYAGVIADASATWMNAVG